LKKKHLINNEDETEDDINDSDSDILDIDTEADDSQVTV